MKILNKSMSLQINLSFVSLIARRKDDFFYHLQLSAYPVAPGLAKPRGYIAYLKKNCLIFLLRELCIAMGYGKMYLTV